MRQSYRILFNLPRTVLLQALFLCWMTLAVSKVAAAQQSSPLNPLSPGSPLSSESTEPNLLLTPTMTPGTAFLFGLEKKFAAAVAEGGGPTFASFFDKDGMTLGNHAAPVIGQTAIAAQATWSPKNYQLTWTPEGGQMSPAGDMGFTWGHYEDRANDAAGNTTVTQGRYITVWKKEPDGTWKVVLDSSNDDVPAAALCECKVGSNP
ncbi:MAG TPA: nuclear transport factor 2 family protein [Acidobacteriaceae bacterium]|nr:nuclear transport factor 2 family protein [Acidobacteriaceae bacterium]